MNAIARQTACLGFVLPFAALLSMTGCPGGGSHYSAPLKAPAVTVSAPVPGATGVPINRKIALTFSQAMDPATIDGVTFRVTGPGGALVAGTVALVSPGFFGPSVATFTPASSLAPNSVYSVTVTTGARNRDGTPLAKDFVWSFTTGLTPDTTAPRVVSSVPAASPHATGVALNAMITATFSEAMDPVSITTGTFLLKQGLASVSGSVSYAGVGATATFDPLEDLEADLEYTATISGARDLAGNALAVAFVWSFTTGSVAETIPPTVIARSPPPGAAGVALNKAVNVTFSEAMNPDTIAAATFEVALHAVPQLFLFPLDGIVSIDVTNRIATFTADEDFDPMTTYDVRITTGVEDVAGNALASESLWSFTTGTQLAAEPVDLQTAAPFGGCGGPAGMTNMGLNTVVNGDIMTTAVSTLITGFHDGIGPDHVYTETPLNAGLVNGTIFADAPAPGTAERAAIAAVALTDMYAAYDAMSPANLPGGIVLAPLSLDGLTLPPGVYFSATTLDLSLVDLTLDGQGDANAVFVFQVGSALTVGTAGPVGSRTVHLINGAQAKNVFWRVGSVATINPAGGGTMVGTIIALSGVAFSTDGNNAPELIVTLNGRALGLNASVTLVNTVINVPED